MSWKSFRIVFSIVILCVIFPCSSRFYSCNASSSDGDRVVLAAEYTLQYTVRVACGGKYYPGRTSIRVELFDIPLQTAGQQVQVMLQHGGMENLDGQEAWVIETTDIYAMNVFTGTFIVRVNITAPPVPSQTPPVSGMSKYLSPDKHVTLHSRVVSQARQLASGAESIPEAVAKFVEWIRKNIAYSIVVGRETRLTDAQVLYARSGVCDEFSTLFIAFCRATGIPARRVLGYGLVDPSGFLYGDIYGYFHSWAEVWVPDYGWLTVDPTWGDIGDARRIATGMKYDGPSLRYQWKNAPPGFGITSVTYSVRLTNYRVVDYVNTPVKLSEEDSGGVRKIRVENNSTVPLLYNVTVVMWDEETGRWQPGSSRIIFLNPDAYCFLNLSRENPYWAYCTVGSSLTLGFCSVSISGPVFMVDGREYRGSTTFLWREHSSHNVSVPKAIEESGGKRRVFQEWSDGYPSTSRTIEVISPGSYSACFKTQYLLTIESDHGTTWGSGWYDENSVATVRLHAGEELAEFPYAYVFKGWAGDAHGESLEVQVVMDSPKVLIAGWEKTFSRGFYIILVGIVAIVFIMFLPLFLRKRAEPPPPAPSSDRLTQSNKSFPASP